LPVTEVAGPNELEDWLKGAGHLLANLLKEELVQFKISGGYLPRVIAIHMPLLYGDEIRGEMAQVAKELGADVSLGYEDMKVIL
jgi:hypothetical protein